MLPPGTQRLPGFDTPARVSRLPPALYTGTSSWSSTDWYDVFYPRGLKPAEFIAYYATRYPAVEIDATYYATPSRRTLEGWRDRTPPGFKFAAKVSKVITHEKVLDGCDAELRSFVSAMEILGDRLGPLLFQFPYFKKADFPTLESYLVRMRPFVRSLPKGFRFAWEIRNKSWVTEELLDLLREANVAFALIDHPYVPRPQALMAGHDVVTADFSYVRWLGDRYRMEEITKNWSRTVRDRSSELREWADVIRRLVALKIDVYTFANNHYGGHAPDTLTLFEKSFLGES